MRSAELIYLIIFISSSAIKLTLFDIALLSHVEFNPVQLGLYHFVASILIISIATIFVSSFKSIRLTAFYILYVLQFIYLFVNLSYYSYFQSYLHITQYILLFGEGASLVRYNAIPTDKSMTILFSDLAPFLLLVYHYSKVENFLDNILAKYRVALASMLTCMLFVIYTWEYFVGISSVNPVKLMNNRYLSEEYIIRKYGLVALNIVDIIKYRDIKTMAAKLNYGEKVSVQSKNNNTLNVILIQVEALDSNIINQQYKNKYIAPFLHELSENSVYFPYMLSYHKGGSTSDAEMSIINSVEPFSEYPMIKMAGYDYPNSMVKRFADDAYHTLAFHNNKKDFFNRNVAFAKMGFNKFYDYIDLELKEEVWGASDRALFEKIIDKLKTQKEPYLYYIITLSSHEPFTYLFNIYRNHDYDDIPNALVKDYFNSISYVDGVLQEFMRYAQELDNTIVIIFGDHSPYYADRDKLPRISNELFSSASFIMDNSKFEFVPLFIITPDHKMRKEKSEAVSFLDIAPTVLSASGIAFELLSPGENLIYGNPEQLEQLIPYNGNYYDRAALFNKAKSTSLN